MTTGLVVKVDVNLPSTKRHPHQTEFVYSTKKRVMVRAGRRGGKTVGAAIKGVLYFLAGIRVLYAAPTTEQVGKFWFEVTKALDDAIRKGMLKKNESELFIEKPGTEQRIKAKTAWNADTLRGDYSGLLILDEYQLMAERTWDEVGAPMLLDKDGDALLIYTPRSLHATGVSKAKDPRHASKMFKRVQQDPEWLTVHYTSMDSPFISKAALDGISKDMTRLAYQQEILAEDIDEAPDALWARKTLDDYRVTQHPTLIRVVVGVDPPGGATECGIICAGRARDGHYYILEDSSLRASPDVWSDTAIKTYDSNLSDKMVGEANFGGDMVENTIKQTADAINKLVNYENVRASRGKAVRAEPVAAAYEQGRVHHVGEFPLLEEELCSWVPGDRDSPNRLDACVWALTELMGPRSGEKPRTKKPRYSFG